jgi:murein DD-endopeptidase MepM/ murein hydrolase activator NlpD
MRKYRPYLISLLILLIVPLTWLIWLLQVPADSGLPAVVLPTLAATAALPTSQPVITSAEPAKATLPPTFTPATTPVQSAILPVTETPPSSSPSPSPMTAPPIEAQASNDDTPTPADEPSVSQAELTADTVTAAPTAAGDPCPVDLRLKPEYERYYLGDQSWPAPESGLSDSHLWLSKPFPGGGRFLINQGFPFGYDGGGRLLLHNGVDSAEPLGTPVLAVADGTIIVAQDDQRQLFGWRCDWYGHLVILELDETWSGQPIYVLYGHVLEIRVEPGQRVYRGQQLAEVGIGGAAQAAHLHLEVRVGANEFGATRNPALWIDTASRGVIAGRLLDPLGRPWRGVGLSLIGRGPDANSGNTWSYMVDPLQIVNINPDEGLAENFVFTDVKPGEYDVYTRVQGVEYRLPVSVAAGQISTLEIVTQPYMTPTPAATLTPPS